MYIQKKYYYLDFHQYYIVSDHILNTSFNFLNCFYLNYSFSNHMLPVLETQSQKSFVEASYPHNSDIHNKLDDDMKSIVNSIDANTNRNALTNLNRKDLFQYFANHISDFIDLALNDTKSLYSKKAFLILSNGPPIVTDAITKDFTFFLKVTELLQNPSNEIDPCAISRIAIIFQSIIFKSEQFSIDSIGFLTQLLPYIEENAVFELFHTIFTTKKQLKNMQNLLSTINIDAFILDELENSSVNTSYSGFFSYLKVYNLLKIISDGLKNKILQKSFQNMRILGILSHLLKEVKESLLLNEIWASIALISDSNLVVKMKDVFAEAMKVISQQFDTLHPYHIYIFDFLSVVVDKNASMFSAGQKKQICQIFQNLCLRFSNSTHLLSSMFNFIRKSLHTREFAQRVLDSYITFLIELGRSEKRTAAAANALIFLADLDQMKSSSYMISKSLTSNRKYILFYNSFFKNYLDNLPKPYGGNVQRYSLAK